MSLQVPEPYGMYIDKIEPYPQLLRDKIGSESSEAGEPSLWGQLLAMNEAMAECESGGYWTGNAASACAASMTKLLTKTAESVLELGTSVTELEKYIELYRYVDEKAERIADEAAAEAAKL